MNNFKIVYEEFISHNQTLLLEINLGKGKDQCQTLS